MRVAVFKFKANASKLPDGVKIDGMVDSPSYYAIRDGTATTLRNRCISAKT